MEGLQDTAARGDAGKLIAQIERERGLDLSQYRLSYVERRLGTRLRALDLPTYRQYAAYLTEHPEEYQRLLDAVTVNVTEFFRDEPTWHAIRDQVVPELVASKLASGHRVIRAWSAGCSTGEEAYSIAMAVLAALGPQASSFVFSVTGTDLDPLALEAAQAGTYDLSRIGQIPPADRARFVVAGEKTFTIRPEVRDRVRFRRLDLFADTPPLSIDLLLCRNVFIYFSREQQERLVSTVFHRALGHGGYLVLGRSEKMPGTAAGQFTPVNTKERVYRKA